MITNEQIGRFFRQECSQEEAETIGRYLEANPDMAYAFLVDTSDGKELEIRTDQSRRLWKHIVRQVHPGRAVARMIVKMAVAASVILCISLCVYHLRDRNTLSGNSTNKAAIAYTVYENKGTGNMGCQLPDGSVVQLSPKSTLRFMKDFEPGKRDVELLGEGRFQVAKDTKRPFTVHSASISTTALGTEFEVKAFAADAGIYVHLVAGKVAVKRRAPQAHSKDSVRILSPGDRLVYFKHYDAFFVNDNAKTLPQSRNPEGGALAGETVIEGENWYMFNNQALSEVLDELARLYHKEIQYNRSELESLSFIGQLDKTDSLHSVLRSIALLNDLKLIKTNTGYILKK